MKSRILFLIFTICVFTASLFSQGPPPPPPPPLIFSAPPASEIKEFKAENFGFKADFAGTPQNTQGKLITGNENVFKTKYKGAETLVRVIEFDFDIEKSVDSNDIFELFKEKYLDEPGNELVSEKAITVSGKNAKEFEIKDTFYFNKIKVVINEDRIYEIFINVTNWHILSRYNPEKVREFQTEAERFHNSFQLISSPNRVANKTIKKIEKGKFSIFQKADFGSREISGIAVQQPKIFDSADGGFKIKFPATPTKKVTNFQAAYGTAQLYQYTLGTTLAFYGVNYFDFPTVINDKDELKIRYKAIKDKLLNSANTRLINENELFFGDNYGYEYLIESSDMTMSVRLITVKQRLFQLIVVTKGKYNSGSENLKNYQKGIKDGFFNSFQITTLPDPKVEAVNLPADFGVSTTNNILKIEFFNFSMALPENWHVVPQSQTQILKELGSQSVQGDKNKETYTFSLKNTEILLLLSKDEIDKAVNNTVLSIAAERSSFPNFLAKPAMESLMKTYLEDDEILLSGPTRTMIGDVEFYWIEIEKNIDKSRQRIYIANRKGIMFEIFYLYKEAEDLAIFLKLLESAKFETSEK